MKVDHRFDRKRSRHLTNGETYVLHCHHYATLYTQLAEDVSMTDGKKILIEVAEDVFGERLAFLFKSNQAENLEDKIQVAEKYYAFVGLGKMKVEYCGPNTGSVVLEKSHIDEGWMKKWGKREKPVNYITCGFIAGMFNALFCGQPRSYEVIETVGIIQGAPKSVFNVVKR
jgi:hypothetical protein